MEFPLKKIITAMAWAAAFRSAAELVLACTFGGFAGRAIARKQDMDETVDSLTKAFSRWEVWFPSIAGMIGLALGMKGLLPGTEDK